METSAVGAPAPTALPTSRRKHKTVLSTIARRSEERFEQMGLGTNEAVPDIQDGLDLILHNLVRQPQIFHVSSPSKALFFIRSQSATVTGDVATAAVP